MSHWHWKYIFCQTRSTQWWNSQQMKGMIYNHKIWNVSPWDYCEITLRGKQVYVNYKPNCVSSIKYLASYNRLPVVRQCQMNQCMLPGVQNVMSYYVIAVSKLGYLGEGSSPRCQQSANARLLLCVNIKICPGTQYWSQFNKFNIPLLIPFSRISWYTFKFLTHLSSSLDNTSTVFCLLKGI